MSKQHPDPHSNNLALLVSHLKRLQAAGQLPDDAAVFWDYGSLPQKPRSVDDQRIFETALKVMAFVYASPLGTSVLQLRAIAPRPAALDGVALACDLRPTITEAELLDALGSHGEITSIEHHGGTADTVINFKSHASAVAAAASDKWAALLGENAFICLGYNERPYHERGARRARASTGTTPPRALLLTLTLESPAAGGRLVRRGGVFRHRVHPVHAADAARPPVRAAASLSCGPSRHPLNGECSSVRGGRRPKIAHLAADSTAVEVVPAARSTMDVKNAIRGAHFTGKGDRRDVLKIYEQLKQRLLFEHRFEAAGAMIANDSSASAYRVL